MMRREGYELMVGKPEIVSKTGETATIKITVQIEPDLKAFKAFTDKLIPVLDKLAKDKGEFTAKFKLNNGRYSAMNSGDFYCNWIP